MVVAFSSWRPAGSIAASVGALLVRLPQRLRALPLNLTIGVLPYTRLDEVTLSLERFLLSDVAGARNNARVARHTHSRTCRAHDGDFVNSDWEYGVRRLASRRVDPRLGINSFVAVDTISELGQLRLGSRPFLGQHAKKGEPRLPRILGLRARDGSQESIARVCDVDLLLINLHNARSQRTGPLVTEVLQARRPDQPTILLAENASELVRLLDLASSSGPLLGLPCTEAQPGPPHVTSIVSRERVQLEQEFDYSLPHGELSEAERELVSLARASWRSQWRTVGGIPSQWSPKSRFTERLLRVRQAAPASADRFRMVTSVLDRLSDRADMIASERLRVLLDAVGKTSGRTLIIVGNKSEEDHVATCLQKHTGSITEIVIARHAADILRSADVCIACGYYGPVTIDATLRGQPGRVFWILDPIEAASAAFECHQQATALAKLGMMSFADLLGAMDQVLFSAAGGMRREAADDHPEIFTPVLGIAHDPTVGLEVEVVDDDPTVLVILSDGSALRTSGARKFDVVRAGAPAPVMVSASELDEGDQILLVRGTYQHTLSELLIDDMDREELQSQTKLRETWAELVRIAVERLHLSVRAIVRRMKNGGASATYQQVRAWLRGEGDYTTPRDRRTFLAFARAIQVALPEQELGHFFDAIRVWRIGHRRRGRDVVRLMRLAWFGGLSAADLARIEEKWGLGVRDLLEGARVVEVERAVKYETEVPGALT